MAIINFLNALHGVNGSLLDPNILTLKKTKKHFIHFRDYSCPKNTKG